MKNHYVEVRQVGYACFDTKPTQRKVALALAEFFAKNFTKTNPNAKVYRDAEASRVEVGFGDLEITVYRDSGKEDKPDTDIRYIVITK